MAKRPAKKAKKKVPAKKSAPKRKALARPKKKPALKAKSPARAKPRPAPKKKKASAPKAKPRAAKARAAAPPHPKLAALLEKLRPGRHAAGTVLITKPDAHHDEMSQWLMGNVAGRVALGRTAFGDIVVFRDLRANAAAQGLKGTAAAEACDVALIDLNLKKMTVLAWSIEELLQRLDDGQFQEAFLRRTLYDQVKARLGDYADDEAYTFVPALALGGSEAAESVQRGNWRVYQEILFQV
jgi:hypothetical protein